MGERVGGFCFYFVTGSIIYIGGGYRDHRGANIFQRDCFVSTTTALASYGTDNEYNSVPLERFCLGDVICRSIFCLFRLRNVDVLKAVAFEKTL